MLLVSFKRNTFEKYPNGFPVKMEAYVNRPCLLTQLQQKLQLDYKTNITQKCQEIKLYGRPTTNNLKKPHSSRQVAGAET